MGFWDFFKEKKSNSERESFSLYDSLKQYFPEAEESKLLKLACTGGLLARIAYVDFKVTTEEKTKLLEILKKEELVDSDEDGTSLVEFIVREIKNLGGLENRIYVNELEKQLTFDEKVAFVESLFMVASSDGTIDNAESEDIRIIAKGLRLSDQNFLAIRAQYRETLGVLK